MSIWRLVQTESECRQWIQPTSPLSLWSLSQRDSITTEPIRTSNSASSLTTCTRSSSVRTTMILSHSLAKMTLHSWLFSSQTIVGFRNFRNPWDYQKMYSYDVDQESSFNLNLMTLDSEGLNIPNTTYSSQVVLPSSDFARICKELSQLSENGKCLYQ